MILSITTNNFFKQHKQVHFVMVNGNVSFEVGAGFLNIMWTNFGFKGLTYIFFRSSSFKRCVICNSFHKEYVLVDNAY
jgi:hypothetical protein